MCVMCVTRYNRATAMDGMGVMDGFVLMNKTFLLLTFARHERTENI